MNPPIPTTTITNKPPRRIAERIAGLGFPLLRVDSEGRAKATGPCSWFERTVAESSYFARAVRPAISQLDDQGQTLIEPIDGVYLVPILKASLSLHDTPAPGAEQYAVMMIGRHFIDSDSLRRLCEQTQIDWKAAQSRADQQRLVSDVEAERLATTLRWMQDDEAGRKVHRQELRSLSEELSNNYEELSLIYMLTNSMALDQPAESFFDEACAELQEVSHLNWVGLQIVQDQPRLKNLQDKFFHAGQAEYREAVQYLGPKLLGEYGQNRDAVIIDDPASICSELAAENKSFLVIPLKRDHGLLAILFGGGRSDGQHLTSIDAKLCTSISNNLAIFLENYMLFEDAQTLFLGTLHALTRAIDAKDSYTFGHSERVAALSKMLALAAGLDEATAERIYLAGLVHDVGKIGVPESVLCKSGKLTESEFEAIKAHPGIGADILQDIRQMEDLIPGVLHHHERWDGRGYPHKLSGLDIPLFGRVIGLADAFDAMSSNRTYRSALDHANVLKEIRKHRGSQFDPQLAETFLGLDFEPFFEMIRRHRTQANRGPA